MDWSIPHPDAAAIMEAQMHQQANEDDWDMDAALAAAQGFAIPEDEAAEAIEDEEPEYFDPRPLKTRRLERERLGEAGCRSRCFGCVYFGEKDTTVTTDWITRLIDMGRQAIGRTDMIALAEGMADYYAKMRRIVNANLPHGEMELPYWPAAQILEHIRHHNQDPQVKQVIILDEIDELRTEMLDRCIEVSSKTGKERPNKFNIACYEKLVKLQIYVQKQDPTKMAFYSAGARVNPEILNQGMISYHTKKLHDLWSK